jgi:NADPH:quinone reductase-like Zn-dependent oxidoreductase
MKAWGADVVATCSTDAIELVTSLGADVAIDYKTQNIQEELSNMEKYDFMCNKLC